jgi:hypothetical protein
MDTKLRLLELTKQLFPTGRAFRIPYNSVKEKFYNGILESEKDAYEDGISILDSILPDNDNFTAEDATRWEQRLGMIDGSANTLEDRKAAIRRKMNHPGDILARQSAGYIQDQLQLAGFDVYIHENIPALTPDQILAAAIDDIGEMGDSEMDTIEMGSVFSLYPDLFIFPQMGEIEMGAAEMAGVVYINMVVNNINEDVDAAFLVGDNYKCCFFVGGQTLGTFADVPETRKDEFRQLILKLKPVQTVGILFINYT